MDVLHAMDVFTNANTNVRNVFVAQQEISYISLNLFFIIPALNISGVRPKLILVQTINI